MRFVVLPWLLLAVFHNFLLFVHLSPFHHPDWCYTCFLKRLHPLTIVTHDRSNHVFLINIFLQNACCKATQLFFLNKTFENWCSPSHTTVITESGIFFLPTALLDIGILHISGYLTLKNATLATLANKTLTLSKLQRLSWLLFLVLLKFCWKWTFIMTFLSIRCHSLQDLLELVVI